MKTSVPAHPMKGGAKGDVCPLPDKPVDVRSTMKKEERGSSNPAGPACGRPIGRKRKRVKGGGGRPADPFQKNPGKEGRGGGGISGWSPDGPAAAASRGEKGRREESFVPNLITRAVCSPPKRGEGEKGERNRVP